LRVARIPWRGGGITCVHARTRRLTCPLLPNANISCAAAAAVADWGMGHVWRVDWSWSWVVAAKGQGSCSQRGCRGRRNGGEGVSSLGGEGVEKVLKRASHALPSADDGPALWAEAPHCFVPQPLVVGGSSGRGARLAWALNAEGGGATGEAKQRPRSYFMSAAGGCCCRDLGGWQACCARCTKYKLTERDSRQHRQQQTQRLVPLGVLRRLPQRQRLAAASSTTTQAAPTPTPTAAHTHSIRRSSRVRQ
jgi:hypothetical protein